MSAATMELAPAQVPLLEAEAPAAEVTAPAGRTLEDVIVGAWQELSERGGASCPVCSGELGPAGCGSCGSELS